MVADFILSLHIWPSSTKLLVTLRVFLAWGDLTAQMDVSINMAYENVECADVSASALSVDITMVSISDTSAYIIAIDALTKEEGDMVGNHP